ncbi:sulfatase [Fulvivirga sedimenti]|uniref:Sulfatase n=1 Tax=Fulvivirga sedimenti TaxID=2879465 RepID=A0A9X1HPI0_9BACT|nr:sulfatase [Fulvivirga sedimenti]MCA6075591.1 sulfatase [Fulvivirga sedimenti]MCA6076768.1 sulfatase [Fulvivirga sedimenti]MCA6077896.1 sulfatase [Fulvivirga sedimenti]
MTRVLFSLFFILIGLNASAQQPNILLIVSDDLNTKIGPYMDVSDHTPNLDRLAKQGVKFTRAYSQYPVCGPSRSSFMSGLYPETNGVLGNGFQLGSYKAATPELKDHPSLAEFFRKMGYYTARVSKIFHMGVPGGIERGETGGDIPESWDYAHNVMGPETMSPGKLELLSPKNNHYGSNFARMILPDELETGQTDYVATTQAIAILENRTGKIPDGATNRVKFKADKPFFLAVGLVRPHVPLIAPENCFAQYPAESMELPEVSGLENVPDQALRLRNEHVWGMSEEQQRKTISAYLASVRFMDQQVGRLLDALDRSGARENTIVIFISDHGFNLGEHDCWSKTSLWEESIRVPMIISAPAYKQSNGSLADQVVELIDLYPTLAELCGLQDSLPPILQGKSLVPMLAGRQAEERYAYTVSYGGRDGALTGVRWKYTRWENEAGGTHEELYDHENDPEELLNLAGDRAYGEVLREMRERFDGMRRLAGRK